jgi:hypothetical protein
MLKNETIEPLMLVIPFCGNGGTGDEVSSYRCAARSTLGVPNDVIYLTAQELSGVVPLRII